MSDEPIPRPRGLIEHLFATLIDLLPDYFYVHDLDMRLVYVKAPGAGHAERRDDRRFGPPFQLSAGIA